MSDEYPIIDVAHWHFRTEEAGGRHPKVWVTDPEDEDGPRWLLKRPKRWPGLDNHKVRSWEDVNEKIVAEIASTLCIPSVTVQLAIDVGDTPRRACCLVRDFSGRGAMQLQTGEQLLKSSMWLQGAEVNEQTLESVLQEFEDFEQAGILMAPSGSDLGVPREGYLSFVGYLLLDVLVLNDDRNWNNWGILLGEDIEFQVAPSFDHGSALAHELDDEKVQRGLADPDGKWGPKAYFNRSQSGFSYDTSMRKRRRVPVMDVFRSAGQRRPEMAQYWVDRLAAVSPRQLRSCVMRVPESRLPASRAEYMARLIDHARERLLEGR